MKTTHHVAFGLSLLTFILIVAGGLVTSTDSGLAVPDWPLSFGTLFPPMVGGIIYEHSHRVIAGGVLIVTFILAVIIFKAKAKSHLKLLISLSATTVLLQALLGGLTVLYLLPTPISIFHATLGQLFFALICVVAWMTSKSWDIKDATPVIGIAPFRKLAIALASAFVLQLILGAWVRHSQGAGVWVHIGMAILILVLSASAFLLSHILMKNIKPLSKLSACIFYLILLQIFLGLSAFYHVLLKPSTASAPNYEVWIATSHQSIGALLLTASVILALNAFHFAKPFESQVQS